MRWLRRLVGVSVIGASAAGVAGAVFYNTDVLNNPWCSSFRVVRFGRATNAVSPVNQKSVLDTFM